MVDLPLSDSEGAIEKQLKSDNGLFRFVLLSFQSHPLNIFVESRFQISLLNISHLFANQCQCK